MLEYARRVARWNVLVLALALAVAFDAAWPVCSVPLTTSVGSVATPTIAPAPVTRTRSSRTPPWHAGRGIAFVTAVIAAGAAAWNAWLNRLAIRVHVLRDLVKEYSDGRIRECRRVAAAALLTERAKEASLFQLTAEVREAEDVLDFFETVGLFVRRHVLDARLVWHTFHRDIAGWWAAAQPLIEHERGQHRQVWGDLNRLVRRLNRIEARYDRIPIDIDKFLREEAALRP